MENRVEELKHYLVPGKRVHLVGIGGVSMRPLGLVLKGMGMIVTGSDMNASVSTDELIANGIQVSIVTGQRTLRVLTVSSVPLLRTMIIRRSPLPGVWAFLPLSGRRPGA